MLVVEVHMLIRIGSKEIAIHLIKKHALNKCAPNRKGLGIESGAITLCVYTSRIKSAN